MGPGETFIALIIGLTFLGYIVVNARHRERMSMMEKGVDPSLYASKGKTMGSITLKLGMLALGVAVGIMVSFIIIGIWESLPSDGVTIACMLLFGGLSLILNYWLERKMHE